VIASNFNFTSYHSWKSKCLQCRQYSASKKQCTSRLIITSAYVKQFTKLFHCQIPEENLHTNIIKILHLTLSMFLHYLVKLENYNCCRFRWHIACKTSEYILQDMRPPIKLRFESYDYKIWKTMQQCSEEDP